MARADIARKLGIRYQHVRGVLIRSEQATAVPAKEPLLRPKLVKPQLAVDVLLASGFTHAGRWTLSIDERVVLEMPLPKEVGVYAFAQDGIVKYVGVATMGLAKRIYFYSRPGVSQKTSLRINAHLREELLAQRGIDIFVATPPDLEWKGLPVHGAAGLELGLIKKYALPWNRRSAG